MIRILLFLAVTAAAAWTTSVARGADLTPAEARAIAREAYAYGFPMIENYKNLHRQAVAPGPFFRAPFNQWAHDAKPATPEVRPVSWPNTDTVLSSAWVDLRAEPVVLTLPAVEKNRYLSAQWVDLQTFNFAYQGTRTTGNDGGDFLVTGPQWQGEKPAGIREVIRCETQFAHLIVRIQLLGPQDLDRVKEIQGGLQLRPLGVFLGQPVTAVEPPPAWPVPRKDMTDGARLFPVLNFLLTYCDPHPSEQEMKARWARLGIGPGAKLTLAELSPEVRQAVDQGLAEVWSKDFPSVMERITKGELTAAECFGSREFLQGDFAKRAIGAKVGIYGNSREETVYATYFSGRGGQALDASRYRYTLRFEKDQLPPCDAFWSLTLYDADTHLLVANPLKRYSIHSSMLESMTRGEDGSLTVYIQKESPGKSKEANWLPAPNGPFHGILRLYLPKPEVIAKTWTAPELVRSAR